MENFYESRKTQRHVVVVVKSSQVPLYGAVSALAGANGHMDTVALPLNLTFVVRSRAYILGRLVRSKFYRAIRCSVTLHGNKLGSPVDVRNSCVYNDWLLLYLQTLKLDPCLSHLAKQKKVGIFLALCLFFNLNSFGCPCPPGTWWFFPIGICLVAIWTPHIVWMVGWDSVYIYSQICCNRYANSYLQALHFLRFGWPLSRVLDKNQSDCWWN